MSLNLPEYLEQKMKKYLIEITESNGEVSTLELETDRDIMQYNAENARDSKIMVTKLSVSGLETTSLLFFTSFPLPLSGRLFDMYFFYGS